MLRILANLLFVLTLSTCGDERLVSTPSDETNPRQNIADPMPETPRAAPAGVILQKQWLPPILGVDVVSRPRIPVEELRLTSTMHDHLYQTRLDSKGRHVVEIPRRGVVHYDMRVETNYLNHIPYRAHDFVVFYAQAGSPFEIRAQSQIAQKNRPTEVDPIIAVYALQGGLSMEDQLPEATAEANVAPYHSATLRFLPQHTGLYALAVFHRELELRLPGQLASAFYGVKIEVSGNSGRGFSYPVITNITIDGRVGEECDVDDGGGIGPLTVCHVRPQSCYRDETERHNLIDVETRPAGCDRPQAYPTGLCSYFIPRLGAIGFQCRPTAQSAPRPCLYDANADEVLCDQRP